MSSGKLSPSVSAKARSEYVGSHEIASTSVSKVRNSSSRSRMPVISPVQTPENANGKKISATAFWPAERRRAVTSWPNWSRSVKSGAASPSESVARHARSRAGLGSSVDVSAASSRLSTLPVALRGSSSRNTISRGTLKRARFCLHVPGARPRDDRAACAPRRRAAACRTRRRRRRRRRPRRPPRGATRQSSTSCGKTFSPPETIISSSRPSTCRRPSSSNRPTSPEDISPVDDLLGPAAGVALEEQPVADEDPAGLAPRQLVPVVVEDLHDGAVAAACRPTSAPARRSSGVAIEA